MSVVRTGEIKALTGLRIVAAMWVVLFHFRPLIWEASPRLKDDLAPLLNSGAQGVDLFFILSGFVLTWNYLDRMGPSWSTRATMHFLWLRLSRVWPIYLVTMHIAALWIIFTLHVGTMPSPDVEKLTAISYVRQLFMVQLWFEPFFDGTSWDGPAWSISAEWLAYLVFGLMILVIFRMATVTRARTLLLLAFIASLPPIILLLASGHFYTPWSWLPRIVAQFPAGALACAAVRRLRLTDRSRRIAGYSAMALTAVGVAILYYYDAHPVNGMIDPGGLVDMLFMPVVVTLAIGVGQPARAAVDPADGLRRADLVQPVHGSRAGAHRVELGGAGVQPRHTEGAAEGRGGRPDRGRGGRGDAVVPHGRGTGAPLDAADGGLPRRQDHPRRTARRSHHREAGVHRRGPRRPSAPFRAGRVTHRSGPSRAVRQRLPAWLCTGDGASTPTRYPPALGC